LEHFVGNSQFNTLDYINPINAICHSFLDYDFYEERKEKIDLTEANAERLIAAGTEILTFLGVSGPPHSNGE